jgi:hypothetical protein
MPIVSQYWTGVNQWPPKVSPCAEGMRHPFLLASGVRSPYRRAYQCRRDLNRGYYHQKEIAQTEV